MGICANTINALKVQTSGLKLANVMFASTLVPYPTGLFMGEYGQPSLV
jgi:hypothetical protein